ncbi:RAD54B protein [Ephemerocybe angulata]|uniref:RAD54B protein n=1 Tax=Ephemerocybe angulata TaxID=980116 RepID=A0A8H6I6W9_9AGAR|nr:RAD54B protein [Tulosesus angulatus]
MPPFTSIVPKKRSLDEDTQTSSGKRPRQLGSGEETQNGGSRQEIWMVQWRLPQTRKHKTWDGDAVLIREPSGQAVLYDNDAKPMGSGRLDMPFIEGKNINFAGKDLEFERPVDKKEYLSGACFGQASSTTSLSRAMPTPTMKKKFISPAMMIGSTGTRSALQDVTEAAAPQTPLDVDKQEESHWTANWRKQQTKKHKTWDGDGYVSLIAGQLRMVADTGKLMGSMPWKGDQLRPGSRLYIGGKEVELDNKIPASQVPGLNGQIVEEEKEELQVVEPPTPVASRGVAASSFYASAKPKPKGPLHDPDAPDAIVMKAPTKVHMQRYNKNNFPVVPVVIDPVIARRLRPHQVEGVKFMYECVMGLRKHEGNGCILADEMGLGKTLQTIALIWTLLKQNPYAAPAPAARKVLIVCPVSLIMNWKAEFQKWLGKDRVGVTACTNDKVNIDAFFYNKNHHVLIIGYERLRTVIDKISTAVPQVDLIVCDEGHRLKSANNKTTTMFQSLRTRRRVILSGTPIQNDLSEFHAMTEFCNPGLLDDYATFKRVYETPILKSRMPEASDKEIEVGEARTEELLRISNEYVVFVTPTTLQASMFSAILNPERLDDLSRGSTADALALINLLTKISNSPILLKATADSAKAKPEEGAAVLKRAGVKEALKLIPSGVDIGDMRLSGKLVALEKMLDDIRENTEEKCVLVSHYTSTLGILEAFCRKKNYSYFRLDGQTPQQKRQEYVNSFNKSSQRGAFIFLLSSKAGGVGINLIGGSRLFLIDSDWNPSHDLQSMARCHRDGQKRPVYIYRLVTAGTIDEKIFQRQVTKLGLSSAVLGSESNSSKSDSFSQKDLRDIFRIDINTGCNTHDLIGCSCDGASSSPGPAATRKLAAVSGKPVPKGFMSASTVALEDTFADQEYLEKKKAELASLSEWKHINCLKSEASDRVLDDVLRVILHDCGPKPKSFSSIKGESTMGRLLEAVDLDNIQAMDKVIHVSDVPGGTVSFLFERGGKETKGEEPEEVLEINDA